LPSQRFIETLTSATAWASKPAPAISMKRRPLAAPSAIGRACPSATQRAIDAGSVLSPISAASTFAVPSGITASGRPERGRPLIASLTVPSPPAT
jgi:hypothetical protein